MGTIDGFFMMMKTFLTYQKNGVFHMKTYWDVMMLLKITCDYTHLPPNFTYLALQMSPDFHLRCSDSAENRATSSLNINFLGHAYSTCTTSREGSKLMRFYGIIKYPLDHNQWLYPVCRAGQFRRNAIHFDPTFEYSLMPIDFGTKALITYYDSSTTSGAENTTMGVQNCPTSPLEMTPETVYLERARHQNCTASGSSALVLWTWSLDPTCKFYSGNGSSAELVAFWATPKATSLAASDCVITSANYAGNTERMTYRPLYNFTRGLLNAYVQRVLRSQSGIDERRLLGAYNHSHVPQHEEDSLIVMRNYLHFSCSCVCIPSLSTDSDVISLEIKNGYPDADSRRIVQCTNVTEAARKLDTSVVRDFRVGKPCYLSAETRHEEDGTVATFLLEASLWHYKFANPSTYACDVLHQGQSARQCGCEAPTIKHTIQDELYVPRILRGYGSKYFQCYCTPVEGKSIEVRLTVNVIEYLEEERSGVSCLRPAAGCFAFAEIRMDDRRPQSQLKLECVVRRSDREYRIEANATYQQDPPAIKIGVDQDQNYLYIYCRMQISLHLHNLTISAGTHSTAHQPNLEAGVTYKLAVKIENVDDGKEIICKCSLQTIGGFRVQTMEMKIANPRTPTVSLYGEKPILTLRVNDPYMFLCNYDSKAFKSHPSVLWNVSGAQIIDQSAANQSIVVVRLQNVRVTCETEMWSNLTSVARYSSLPYTAIAKDEPIYIVKNKNTCTKNTTWTCELHCILPHSSFSDQTTVLWYQNDQLTGSLKPSYTTLPTNTELEVLNSKITLNIATATSEVSCSRKIGVTGILNAVSTTVIVAGPESLGTPEVTPGHGEPVKNYHIGEPYQFVCKYPKREFRTSVSIDWSIVGGEQSCASSNNTCLITPSEGIVVIDCAVQIVDSFGVPASFVSRPFEVTTASVMSIHIIKAEKTCEKASDWLCELHCVLPDTAFVGLTAVSWYANGKLYEVVVPKYRRLDDANTLTGKLRFTLFNSSMTMVCERSMDIKGVPRLRSERMVLSGPESPNDASGTGTALIITAGAVVLILGALTLMLYVCYGLRHPALDDDGMSSMATTTGNVHHIGLSIYTSQPMISAAPSRLPSMVSRIQEVPS